MKARPMGEIFWLIFMDVLIILNYPQDGLDPLHAWLMSIKVRVRFAWSQVGILEHALIRILVGCFFFLTFQLGIQMVGDGSNVKL